MDPASSKSFFEFSEYHVVLAAVGAAILFCYWVPRFFSGREPAASALLIIMGAGAFWLIPGMPPAIDPVAAPRLWEVVSEVTVIVALFATGLRIDSLGDWRRWSPTARLLLIVMPLSIASVALLGWWLGGLTLGAAVLLGAVLAPTDPVLAGDVQVGPPTEGGEHPVRFALTTEAGLNDGLTFPFVYLGMLLVAQPWSGELALEWFARDLVYRIAVGAIAGVVLGWLLGKVMFALPRRNALAETGSGLLALAGVLLCYGLTELLEGYGFIAAFVAGLVLRRAEAEHDFHATLHAFNEAIEHALTALLLVLLGAALPLLWPLMDWRVVAISLLLIFLIRPLAAWLALHRTHLQARSRLVVAFYGVRGVGSIYYLAFAASHAGIAEAGQLWAIVGLTILISTIIHGLTAGIAVETAVEEDADEVEPAPAGGSTQN